MKLRGISACHKKTITLVDNYIKEDYERAYNELSRDYKYILEIDDEGIVKVIKDTRNEIDKGRIGEW